MVSQRRKARSMALQALYEIDSSGHKPEDVVRRLSEEEPLPDESMVFVRRLVEGVMLNRERLDATIRTYASAWPLEQIPIIDRNLLRLAIFEILIDNVVPIKVAINEAVELAKRFGSDSSPRFVNGVLGSVSSTVVDKRT